jgi:hypothetical protein
MRYLHVDMLLGLASGWIKDAGLLVTPQTSGAATDDHRPATGYRIPVHQLPGTYG